MENCGQYEGPTFRHLSFSLLFVNKSANLCGKHWACDVLSQILSGLTRGFSNHFLLRCRIICTVFVLYLLSILQISQHVLHKRYSYISQHVLHKLYHQAQLTEWLYSNMIQPPTHNWSQLGTAQPKACFQIS